MELSKKLGVVKKPFILTVICSKRLFHATKNIYSKKSSRFFCRKRAYPAAQNRAAAGKGHIRQSLKSGSISIRAIKKKSLIQGFFIDPHFFKFFKTTNTIKNLNTWHSLKLYATGFFFFFVTETGNLPTLLRRRNIIILL